MFVKHTLRLLTSFCGLISVVCTVLSVRELFPERLHGSVPPKIGLLSNFSMMVVCRLVTMSKRISAVVFKSLYGKFPIFWNQLFSLEDVLYNLSEVVPNKLSVTGWSSQHNALNSSFLSGWSKGSLRRYHRSQYTKVINFFPYKSYHITYWCWFDTSFPAFNNKSNCWGWSTMALHTSAWDFWRRTTLVLTFRFKWAQTLVFT